MHTSVFRGSFSDPRATFPLSFRRATATEDRHIENQIGRNGRKDTNNFLSAVNLEYESARERKKREENKQFVRTIEHVQSERPKLCVVKNLRKSEKVHTQKKRKLLNFV